MQPCSRMCYLHMICQNFHVIGLCLQNLISGYLFLTLKPGQLDTQEGQSLSLPQMAFPLPPLLAMLPWQVGCQRALRGEQMLGERGHGPGWRCTSCFYSTRSSMRVKNVDRAQMSLCSLWAPLSWALEVGSTHSHEWQGLWGKKRPD